ncbi:MAG: hypothetical protein ACREVL_01105 [Solimonas sp.]
MQRSGASHPKAVHGADVVEQARQMRDRGRSYGQITARLVANGVNVSYWTVRDWCDYRTRSAT